MALAKQVWWSALCAAALSCTDDHGVALPPVTQERAPTLNGDASADTRECDQAPNGTPCGKPGGGTHCVFDVCMRNTCGDGFVADGEECDDGDELDADGCDSRCRLDIPGCTNGVLDGDEECDDGNRDDSDLCTNRCTNARCGDGSRGPGEECDDGNGIDADSCTLACRPPLDAGTGAPSDAGMDAGGPISDAGGVTADAGRDAATDAASDAESDAASDPRDASSSDAMADAGSDAGTDGASDAATEASVDANAEGGAEAGSIDAAVCDECRTRNFCREIEGVDFVAGCYGEVPGEHDPVFIQECIDVMSCAQAHDCAYGADGPLGCYCGVAIDQCNTSGPAANAPCLAQWRAAARSNVNTDVLANVSNISFPVAWAFFLLDCDRTRCAAECRVPR